MANFGTPLQPKSKRTAMSEDQLKKTGHSLLGYGLQSNDAAATDVVKLFRFESDELEDVLMTTNFNEVGDR